MAAIMGEGLPGFGIGFAVHCVGCVIDVVGDAAEAVKDTLIGPDV